MESEVSQPFSQKAATDPCPELQESNPQFQTPFLKI